MEKERKKKMNKKMPGAISNYNIYDFTFVFFDRHQVFMYNTQI